MCVCVYMCVYIYIYIYIYTHTQLVNILMYPLDLKKSSYFLRY